jgi:hypothetical protein
LIRVLIPSCKNHDFIPMQVKSFVKHCKDDFKITVLNDGLDDGQSALIREACLESNVECIDVPKNLIHSSASVAHCAVVQWAYDEIVLKGCMGDIVVMLDSDMFMVRDFSFSELVGDFAFAGLPQYRGPIKYYFMGFLVLNMPKLPNPSRLNMFCGIVRGHNVDSGGMIWHYINENPGILINDVVHTSHIKSSNNNLHCLPDKVREKYDENYNIEILQSSFLNYGGASTRNDPITNMEKMKFLKWLLDQVESDTIKMPEIQYVFKE